MDPSRLEAAAEAMTRTILLILLFIAAREVRAEEAVNLRGQWQLGVFGRDVTAPSVILIDADHRVTWDSDKFKVKLRGYVAHADPMKVEIVMTDSVGVFHTYCALLSSDLLNCRARLGDKWSRPYVMTRVGPGPKKLAAAAP
jgi:hypothetical protein